MRRTIPFPDRALAGLVVYAIVVSLYCWVGGDIQVHFFDGKGVGVFLVVLWALVTLAYFLVLLDDVIRAIALDWYRRSPQRLEKAAADLDSPRQWRRRLALQRLADYAGEPFGTVRCWPLQNHSRIQFESLVALYREWWAVREALAEGHTLSQQLCRRSRALATAALRAGWSERSGIKEISWNWPALPPLNADGFVREMLPEVEAALREVAHAINEASRYQGIASCEEVIGYLLAELLWNSLETGLCMRAAGFTGPPPCPPAPPSEAVQPASPICPRPQGTLSTLRARAEEAMGRAADAVKDVLLDWNPDDEDRPEEEEREPLPPLEPGPFRAALRGEVEAALDRVAQVLNEAPDVESMTARAGDVRLCFEWLVPHALERAEQLRLDEAVARLSPAEGPQGGWVKKFRRMKVAEGRLSGPPGDSDVDQ
jgi:hypothetical protein